MLVELIIIVAIVWWVVKKKKDAANGGNPGNGAGPQVTVTPARQQRGNTDYFQRNTAPKSNAGTRNAVEEAKQDGHSTTAYLMEKAQADAREHAKEKMEEQKRLSETRGNLAVAERLFDGDPVPQGKRCVVCSYCGAENLVPMMPRTSYSCYFCREPLN